MKKSTGSFRSLVLLSIFCCSKGFYTLPDPRYIRYGRSSSGLRTGVPPLETPPPEKTKQTFGLLTKGPPQQLYVPIVRFVWNYIWKLMVSELAPHDKEGRFIRDYSKASFVSASISKLSPTSSYHLYLGNPCPWCHRIFMALVVLSSPITYTKLVDNAEKATKGGWIVDKTNSPDPLCDAMDLAGIYNFCTNGEYNGRCTAPLLIDLTTATIVSNESNEILRLLSTDENNGNDIDLYPEELATNIDKANNYYYNSLQNGVYRCGFATSQLAYQEAANDVDEGLKVLEKTLSKSKFVVGDKFTEADLKLWPFACRFDGAYSVLFRAPGGKLKSYAAIHNWARRVASIKNMNSTIDVGDAVGSYYRQLFMLNPSGIVPAFKETIEDLFEMETFFPGEKEDIFHHKK